MASSDSSSGNCLHSWPNCYNSAWQVKLNPASLCISIVNLSVTLATAAIFHMKTARLKHHAKLTQKNKESMDPDEYEERMDRFDAIYFANNTTAARWRLFCGVLVMMTSAILLLVAFCEMVSNPEMPPCGYTSSCPVPDSCTLTGQLEVPNFVDYEFESDASSNEDSTLPIIGIAGGFCFVVATFTCDFLQYSFDVVVGGTTPPWGPSGRYPLKIGFNVLVLAAKAAAVATVTVLDSTDIIEHCFQSRSLYHQWKHSNLALAAVVLPFGCCVAGCLLMFFCRGICVLAPPAGFIIGVVAYLVIGLQIEISVIVAAAEDALPKLYMMSMSSLLPFISRLVRHFGDNLMRFVTAPCSLSCVQESCCEVCCCFCGVTAVASPSVAVATKAMEFFRIKSLKESSGSSSLLPVSS